MRIILVIIAIILTSCNVQESKDDYYSELVALNIKYSNGNWNSIYLNFNDNDKYSESDLKTIEPILVERLKKIGFKILDSSFCNYTNDSRVLKINLQKDDCNCTVHRIYENSKLIDSYRIEEKIRCYTNKD